MLPTLVFSQHMLLQTLFATHKNISRVSLFTQPPTTHFDRVLKISQKIIGVGLQTFKSPANANFAKESQKEPKGNLKSTVEFDKLVARWNTD